MVVACCYGIAFCGRFRVNHCGTYNIAIKDASAINDELMTETLQNEGRGRFLNLNVQIIPRFIILSFVPLMF